MAEHIPRRSFVKKSIAATILANPVLLSGLVRASGSGSDTTVNGGNSTIDSWDTTYGQTDTTIVPFDTTLPPVTFLETTGVYSGDHYAMLCDSAPKKSGGVTVPVKKSVAADFSDVVLEMILECTPSGPNQGDVANEFDFQATQVKAYLVCKRRPFKVVSGVTTTQLDTSITPTVVITPTSSPTGHSLTWSSGTHTKRRNYDTGEYEHAEALTTSTKTISASYYIGDSNSMVVTVYWEIDTSARADEVKISTKSHLAQATASVDGVMQAVAFADPTTAREIPQASALVGAEVIGKWRTKSIRVP